MTLRALRQTITHNRIAMASPASSPANAAARFINGLAWSFIGLSAITAVMVGIQYLVYAHLLPTEALRAAVSDAIEVKLLPTGALAVLEKLPLILIVTLAACLLTLGVSAALLRRRPWARVTFAIIMIITALLHFAGVLLPFFYAQQTSAWISHMPPEIHGVATMVMRALAAMSMIMGIGFGAGFAWIAKRLLSSDIRKEFQARAA